MKVDEEHP